MLVTRIYSYLKKLPGKEVSKKYLMSRARYDWRVWKSAFDDLKENAVDIAVEYRDGQEYYTYVPLDSATKHKLQEGLKAFETWK